MKMRIQGWVLVAAMGFLLCGGCMLTPRYDILVNGYLDLDKGFDPAAAFCVIQNEKAGNAILEKELAGKAGDLLARAGHRVTTRESADYLIRFYYGTRSGTQVETEYIEDPFMSYHFYGYHYWPWGCWGYRHAPRSVSTVSMLYHHSMSLQVLEAEPFRKNGTAKVAWVGEASCSTSLPDLRTALHFMLKALFEYFGEDTRIGRVVTLEHIMQAETGTGESKNRLK